MIAGLLRVLRAARALAPRRHVSVTLGPHIIGWVRSEQWHRLRAWPALFDASELRIEIRPAEEPALSAAFAQVAQALAGEGVIRGWRGETYAVRASGSAKTLFHLERAAMRFFGFTAVAAHLNGFAGEGAATCFHIARRAATKSIDPGMLDNLVAGGVTSLEDAWQALVRECGEEADIPAALARTARPAGVLRVCEDASEGMHSETLHVYDLALPAGFAPRNTDGEVGEFLVLDAPALLERIAQGEMTVAAALVTLEFASRRGALPDDGGKIRAAIEACRLPAPT